MHGPWPQARQQGSQEQHAQHRSQLEDSNHALFQTHIHEPQARLLEELKPEDATC